MSRPRSIAFLVGTLLLTSSHALAGSVLPVINPANGHGYYVTEDVLTWDASEAWATSLGGHLVTVNDAAENAWILGNLTLTSARYWTGARDDANTTDTIFDWISGEPWGYANWMPGEPDNDAGISNQGDFVALDRITGQWFDSNGFNPEGGAIAEVVSPTAVDPVSSAAPSNPLSLRILAVADGVRVRIDLARSMVVQIRVFDVAGRPVCMLFRGGLNAGAHDLRWDEQDSNGRVARSGIYFVSAQAEGARRTGRAVIAR